MAKQLFKSLGDQVFSYLKDKIVNNEMEPGTMLFIDKLASEFGVSTTPIREALVRLEALDLVSIQRNKGAVVSEMSKDKILHVLEMRRLLETYGCRSAAMEITDEEITRLSEILRKVKENPSDFDYYKYSDIELHGTIIKHIRNDLIKEALTNLSIHSRRIRYYAETTPFLEDVILQVTKEHEAIFKALAKRDPELLEKEMRKHLFNAEQRTLKALATSENGIEH